MPIIDSFRAWKPLIIHQHSKVQPMRAQFLDSRQSTMRVLHSVYICYEGYEGRLYYFNNKLVYQEPGQRTRSGLDVVLRCCGLLLPQPPGLGRQYTRGRSSGLCWSDLQVAALLFSSQLFKVLSQQEDFSPLKQYFLAT